MRRLTLLHISDFHWELKTKTDREIVIQALLADIEQLRSERELHPDAIIFSGDLVLAGENPASFAEAKEALLDRVLSATNLPAHRLFLVPGNHDIARSVVRETNYIEQGLSRTLNNIENINEFIDSADGGKTSALPALLRMQNFYEFERSLPSDPSLRRRSLVRTFKFDHDGISVGVACFDTAWRSTGEADSVDRRNLILGERNVDNAILDLNDSDVRLAVFHHPFDWLTEADEIAVASRIYGNFDAIFTGHIHRSYPEFRVTPNGSAILSQSGCLYEKRSYFNGYQFVELDLDIGEANFTIRTYQPGRRAFDSAVDVVPGGITKLIFTPHSARTSDPGIIRFLQEVRPVIRQTASEHINITGTVGGLNLDLKEAFICPPLTYYKRAQIDDTLDADDTDEPTSESILRSAHNYVFVGKSEAGKSSLSHYLAVMTAEGTCDKSRIPVWIDFKTFRRNKYGIKKAFSQYFGVTRQYINIDKSLESGDFIFFVDNYSGLDVSAKKEFLSLSNEFGKCRWIVFADSRPGGTDSSDASSDFIEGWKLLQIQPLPRRAIRELSRRWSTRTGSNEEKTFSAVMSQIKSGGLPRTGYIVTLLLWAMYTDRKLERVNEAFLLTNMLDYLLGKADFKAALRREFDPVAKEITLQSLAKFMRDRGGFASVNDTIIFLIDFFGRKALRFDAGEVLAGLVNCGILKKIDLVISFKYPCFQDYFFALFLRANQSELDKCLESVTYIYYTRELELLSGLRRQNADLLRRISDDIAQMVPDGIEKIRGPQIEAFSNSPSAPHMTRKKLIDIRTKQLTSEQIDDLIDKAESKAAKHPRREVSVNGSSTGSPKIQEPASGIAGAQSADGRMSQLVFTLAVDLLGKIAKNSEFDDAQVKTDASIAYITYMSKYLILISSVIEEVIKNSASEDPDFFMTDPEEIQMLIYLLNVILVTFFSNSIFDSFGSEKMIPIYHNIFHDKVSPPVLRLMVAMLLLDIKADNWDEYWKSLIEKHKREFFVLNALVEKIWFFIHRNPTTTDERQKVEDITTRLETALGTSKLLKSRVLEKIRAAESRVERREAGGNEKPKRDK